MPQQPVPFWRTGIRRAFILTVFAAMTMVASSAAATNFYTEWLSVTASPEEGTEPFLFHWDEQFIGVGVDSSGNAFAAGQTDGTIGGRPAGATSPNTGIVGLTATGSFDWADQRGGASSDIPYGIATDTGGNSYVAGTTRSYLGTGSSSKTETFLAKYNSAGSPVWTEYIPTDGSGDTAAWAVTLDGAGNPIVVGESRANVGGATNNGGLNDAFIVKYNPSGTVQWSQHIGTNVVDVAHAVITDNVGNIYVTGLTRGDLDGTLIGGRFDAFVAKLGPGGAVDWVTQAGSAADDRGWDIAVDPDGNVFVVGQYSLAGAAPTGHGSFLSRFDSNGDLVWSKPIAATDDSVTDLVYSSVYGLVLAGFTPGPNNDLLLANYDLNGNELWTESFGTDQIERVEDITRGPNGQFYIAGWTKGDLGGLGLADGSENAFVARIVIPEPTTAMLAAFGLLAALPRRR